MTRVIPPQMTLLIDLLSEEGVLENGNVNYANVTRQNFWKRMAVQLNSVEGGVCKNAYKWCKMWADWKNKTKKKADILFKKKSYDFNPQTPILTTLELRLLKIIGYPLNENATNIINSMELTGKAEPPDNITDISVDYLAEDLPDEKNEVEVDFDIEDEDDKALRHFARKKRKYKRSRSAQDEDKSDAFDDSANVEKKMKYEGRSKESFEEFKTRTKLELEKERAQQKSEELRLKALELKLKGDELRLKEIEMNKVNYLTSIEEEKLKCFRDISSSLKEPPIIETRGLYDWRPEAYFTVFQGYWSETEMVQGFKCDKNLAMELRLS